MQHLRSLLIMTFLALAFTACAQQSSDTDHNSTQNTSGDKTEPAHGKLKYAEFAGGCFWCMEHAFDQVPGVVETISGYTGGNVKDPSYRQVSSGTTGHAESLRVGYDPSKIDYKQLLNYFWHNVDPTDAGGAFCDRGNQYRSAIWYLNDKQKQLAEASKKALESAPNTPKPIVTEITQAGTFYPAEDYHQNYSEKNPLRYKFYVTACGRYDRLDELWGSKARPQIHLGK